jgi:hypothetical protein
VVAVVTSHLANSMKTQTEIARKREMEMSNLYAFSRRLASSSSAADIYIAVAQSTVSVYMVPRRDRPLQTWKTFLRNHMEGIASIDLFVVPTIAFEQLFAFLVLGHKRRQLLWFSVTRNPTAEWLARQITEAFPWGTAPKYLIRDNDRAFGAAFRARVRAMGIRDRPTSFRSPWQNGLVERLIGSARHECTDHVIVFNEDHLRKILSNYASYYNEVRTHLSLGKDTPYTRPIERLETSLRSRSLASERAST